MNMNMNMNFNNIFANKTVLITGHTGFKGSWISLWLSSLGANIIGISDNVPTQPASFSILNLDKSVNDIRADICDVDKLSEVISSEKPDFIFHMAAQALVRKSYDDPIATIRVNTLGTASLLESIKRSKINKKLVVSLITSDKVYENKEWVWGYRESDKLGGHDPYSSSKSASEIIIESYFKSFFINSNNDIRFSIVRAGNVIGGGDWAQDRIVPDAVRAANLGKSVEIRNPNSTRPWQHVLEPLGGYLLLASKAYNEVSFNYEAFNFGPNSGFNKTVMELIDSLSQTWPSISSIVKTLDTNKKEANLLQLSCDKSEKLLNWKPVLSFEQTCSYTASWYKNYYTKSDFDMTKFTLLQIKNYSDLARLKW
jgi:CDP-glucose 4,6-dehydratase